MWLDLEALGSQPIVLKNLPGTLVRLEPLTQRLRNLWQSRAFGCQYEQ
jgi:hypothetical protein